MDLWPDMMKSNNDHLQSVPQLPSSSLVKEFRYLTTIQPYLSTRSECGHHVCSNLQHLPRTTLCSKSSAKHLKFGVHVRSKSCEYHQTLSRLWRRWTQIDKACRDSYRAPELVARDLSPGCCPCGVHHLHLPTGEGFPSGGGA